MAYSEPLAERVRALLADRGDVAERPMFGGLTFMVGGHMCCGVHADELIVRLHPDDEDAALARPTARRSQRRSAECRGASPSHGTTAGITTGSKLRTTRPGRDRFGSAW
jgi:hypothetical protein